MNSAMHKALRDRQLTSVFALVTLLGLSQVVMSQTLSGARTGAQPHPVAEAPTTGAPSVAGAPNISAASNVASKLDRSGRVRVGKASFYATRFGGRKMADGSPMRLQGNNAASKTLPLGTTAVVTNLETHRAATVTIRDRGPYVKGRIVDLSPAMAHQIGLDPKEGVAKVAVTPIAVPLPDGQVKLTAKNSLEDQQGSRSRDEWLD